MTIWLNYSLVPGGKAPVRATEGAAAYDLHARLPRLGPVSPGLQTIPTAMGMLHQFGQSPVASVVVKIPLGVRFAIPSGYFGMLCARSSSGAKGLVIPNGLGVIDSDYRGEVMAMFLNLSGEDIVIRDGDRIAQLIILPVPDVVLRDVPELDATERGDGGFGSTGK